MEGMERQAAICLWGEIKSHIMRGLVLEDDGKWKYIEKHVKCMLIEMYRGSN